MAVPSLTSQMQQFAGPQGVEPVTPEALLEAESPYFNPVTDHGPDVPYGAGGEPMPLSAASTSAASTQLPEGPESTMSGDEARDMHDMLAERMKAREARSAYFQEKAMGMAREHF